MSRRRDCERHYGAQRARLVSASASRDRDRPLEQRLFWIVVAGLLPLILLSFATLRYNVEAHKRQQIQAAENTMRSVIAAVDAVRSDVPTRSQCAAAVRRSLAARHRPGAVEATVGAGVSGVGNLIWSPVLNMYVFAVRLPIREADRVPYVLDGRRIVVARTRNHLVGRKVSFSDTAHDVRSSRGAQAGFDAYLVKPVDAARLNELIARVCVAATG